MDQLLETVKKVRSRINEKLTIKGILPTMYNRQTNHSQLSLQNIKDNYQELVFDTVIPYTVKLQDSVLSNQGITEYQPQSEAAKAYRKLVKEIYGN